MQPKLVLSNTTTFFSGNIERVFKKAKKHGFSYVELVTYRWINPEKILKFEKKYSVEVAGIHMPQSWNTTFWQTIKKRKGPFEKLLTSVFVLYLGSGKANPGLLLAQKLKQQHRNPYVLFHSILIEELKEDIADLSQQFNVVIENVPYQKKAPVYHWNPVALSEKLREYSKNIGLVFDTGHFERSMREVPNLDITQTYSQTRPYVLHIGYDDNAPVFHTLPRKKSQKNLIKMLKLHSPEYIVIETNPWVSIKKAKALLIDIINKSKA